MYLIKVKFHSVEICNTCLVMHVFEPYHSSVNSVLTFSTGWYKGERLLIENKLFPLKLK